MPSFGGQDPRKMGPIRSLVAYYAKKPHPFTACARDNRKRFGPTTNRVCAWIKDQIRGTTYWRGHEGAREPVSYDTIMEEAMVQEGYSRDQINAFLADGDPIPPDWKPDPSAFAAMCDNMGVEYDPNGFDGPCPECGQYAGCSCNVDWDKMHMQAMSESMLRVLREASTGGSSFSSAKTNLDKALATPGGSGDLKAINAALIDSKATLKSTKAASKAKTATPPTFASQRAAHLGGTMPNPREVVKAENGTSVFDDGSIKDTKTGVTKHPVKVFMDGSVMYDDGSVAKPGSLAALMVVSPMSREDKAKLFIAGKDGLPLAQFASVQHLVNQAAGQSSLATGETKIDQNAQYDAMSKGLSPANMAAIAGEAARPELERRTRASDQARMDMKIRNLKAENTPVRLQRGEKATQGPDGGRGVWRKIGGHSIFILLGQTPAQARQQQTAKAR